MSWESFRHTALEGIRFACSCYGKIDDSFLRASEAKLLLIHVKATNVTPRV